MKEKRLIRWTRMISICLTIGLMLSLSASVSAVPDTTSKPAHVRIAVVSDPHYFAPELGTKGRAFEDVLAHDRKMLAVSAAITIATLQQLKQSDANIVIFCGDLTKDGELLSHQQFAELLQQLKATGKQVYVIDGNHDINNPSAVKYDGDKTTDVPSVSPQEFVQIYKDFGYGQAIARDPSSLSYVVEPVPGLRLIAMDSPQYENLASGASRTAGALTPTRLAWIEGQLRDAKAAGATVLGFMHHGLLNHFTLESLLFSEYVIKDFDHVSTELANLGLNVVFTGHFHAQDIVKKSVKKSFIYDIETGSLVTYPCPYRIVELTADHHLQITSSTVPSIRADLGGKTFPEYAKEYLIKDLNQAVPSLVTSTLVKQGMPRFLATPLVKGLIATPITPTLKVSDFIIKAMVGHYQGDERSDPPIKSAIQKLDQSKNPALRLLGSMFLSLYTDLPPADNNLNINLTTGAAN